MGGNVLIAILILGLLIFVHELGHFAVAKWSGVTVLRFSLGFGPRLLAWRRGVTEYAVSAVPLGGYVKMLGDDPEDEVPNVGRRDTPFRSKSLAKRLGDRARRADDEPGHGVRRFHDRLRDLWRRHADRRFRKSAVSWRAWRRKRPGLRRGDTVVSIDGKPIATWDALSQAVRASGGTPLALEVRRDDGNVERLTAVPEERPEKTVFGEETGKAYLIGIERFVEIAPVSFVKRDRSRRLRDVLLGEDDAAERREDLSGFGVGARSRRPDPDRAGRRVSRPSAASTI